MHMIHRKKSWKERSHNVYSRYLWQADWQVVFLLTFVPEVPHFLEWRCGVSLSSHPVLGLFWPKVASSRHLQTRIQANRKRAHNLHNPEHRFAIRPPDGCPSKSQQSVFCPLAQFWMILNNKENNIYWVPSTCPVPHWGLYMREDPDEPLWTVRPLCQPLLLTLGGKA